MAGLMGLFSGQPASPGTAPPPQGLLDLILGSSNPISQFADSRQNVLGAIGAGLASGPTFAQGLANAAQAVPQARQADYQMGLYKGQVSQTVKYLQDKHPDLAQAVASGTLSPSQAFQQAIQLDHPAGVAVPMTDVLRNPQTGEAMGGGGATAGYRPLTDPAERAKYGISPNDTGPYQVDPMGKISYAGSPNTNVNVSNTSESAFAKAVGDARGANYTSVSQAAQAAQNNIQTLSQLGGVLQTSGYQGPGGETALQLRKIGSALGIDTSATNDAQVAEALSRQLALQFRNPQSGAGMPGNLSNSDRQYLSSMAPGLDKTPGANQKLVDSLIKVEQRKQEVATLADQYVKQNGTLDSGFNDLVTQYNASHPIFGGQTNFSAAAAAPSGAVDYRSYFGGQ